MWSNRATIRTKPAKETANYRNYLQQPQQKQLCQFQKFPSNTCTVLYGIQLHTVSQRDSRKWQCPLQSPPLLGHFWVQLWPTSVGSSPLSFVWASGSPLPPVSCFLTLQISDVMSRSGMHPARSRVVAIDFLHAWKHVMWPCNIIIINGKRTYCS